jgi:hypothetical protein
MTLKWAGVDSDRRWRRRVVSADGRMREVDLADALHPAAVRDALLFASRHHASLLAARSAQQTGARPENETTAV